jgi:hypothetical protein
MLTSTSPVERRSTSFGPDHVLAEAKRPLDYEIATFGGCVHPPEARRQKPRVSPLVLPLAQGTVWKNRSRHA